MFQQFCPTFLSDLFIRYNFQLALVVVVVDRENNTQFAMQALVPRERTEGFVFIFETFRNICGESHPKVMRPFNARSS